MKPQRSKTSKYKCIIKLQGNMNELNIRKSRTGFKILLEVRNRAGLKGYTESISLSKSCITVSIKIYEGKQRYT